ncbi:phage head morphogenesis protein [Klebsiella oxytoca]|uniref:phage head morphogenesis protein n=1 Tax=Klebsiella oxytoca TaxID=571 RepID=UPI001CCF2EDB|nr:phage head morphogenesis protein [Klebsiella oxytoca]MBZ7262476.1 phage head morphogenesis protein [Klebsiella oxytoca]
MAESVQNTLIPVLKRYKQLTADSVSTTRYTADSFLTDLIRETLRQASEQFFSDAFGEQQRRMAQTVVSRAESETSAAFVDQINRALGINIEGLINRESLGDFFDAAVEENVALIRSLSSDYFDNIQRAVMDSVLRGDSLTTQIRNMQGVTQAEYNRAELIARDQSLKISSDINRKRQTSAGIDRFRWSTSQDVRVSGNPAGKYPKAKISCFTIARIDVGYGPGVYLWEKGASYNGEIKLMPGRAHIGCRCTGIPQIKGLDYK